MSLYIRRLLDTYVVIISGKRKLKKLVMKLDWKLFQNISSLEAIV